MLARLCSVITNLAGSVYGKKGQFKQTKPKDFLPVWDDPGPKKQTVEEMKEVLKSIARVANQRHGKVDITKRPPHRLRKKK